MIVPVSAIGERLSAAAQGRLDPIDDHVIDVSSREHAALYKQFNAMVRAQAEREAMAAELAKQEQLAMLGRLASSMAHEVNNPLGGLMNAVDTLEAHGDEPTARHRVIDLLRRGLRGIQQVVRAALVTYKTEHHARHLTHADLQDLRFLIQHETGAKKLQLDWSNELPDVLEVDASPIRQIVLNLLLNACHASPEGGTVALRAALDGEAITISVADEGPGLPPAAMEAITSGGSGELATRSLEPRARPWPLDGGKARQAARRNLGRAVGTQWWGLGGTRDSIELRSGRIPCRRMKGPGSGWWRMIPSWVNPSPIVSTSKATMSIGGNRVRTPCEPCAKAPDLLVCDIRLPDINGEALFDKVIPDHPGLPVLFITGFAQVDQAVRLMRAGAADYVVKPFAMQDFLARSRS